MFVSVVVPVLNDAEALRTLLSSFQDRDNVEIIIAEAGGSGGEMSALRREFPHYRWVRSLPGRARQMNAGARLAEGAWVLFLHADTKLPTAWLDEVRRADAIPEVVAGCFRFALDSADWRARVIERGAALRVRWLALPYGDQALFVRREVFERLGGYANLPLMEDVELVGRLRREGRLWYSTAAALTSDRRWRRDGWLRRSVGNLWLLNRYFAGTPASRLAAAYYGESAPGTSRAVVAVLARAPSDTGGKTRLVGGLPEARAAALRRALLLDTMAGVVEAGRDVDIAILYTPSTARQEFEEVNADAILVPQSGESVGDRMFQGLLDLFAQGYDVAIMVGSDLPTLPGSLVREAVEALRRNAADVVLGPAEDGGYYLLGLREPHEQLFRGVEWSTATVLASTTAAAHALGLRMHLLPSLRDVDTPEDLDALLIAGESGSVTHLREWAKTPGDR